MLEQLLSARIKQSYEDKCILITGSSGYIASNFVQVLKDINCRIIRVSRPHTDFKVVDGVAQIEDVHADISAAAVWNDLLEGVDFIFHFAASVSYAGNQNPTADLKANFMPMQRLLEACWSQQRAPVVIFAGTVTEVGFTTTYPIDETYPDSPITMYDLHKLMAENYLKYYTRQQVVRGASLRLANVYGPGPKWSSVNRGVLNIMIKRALNDENDAPLTIYGTGDYLRDFVYIGDIVRAFLLAGVHIDRLNGGHFVIGTGQGHTLANAIHMVAERIKQKTGRVIAVKHVEPPMPSLKIETRNFVADTARFCKATGWQAVVSLAEGIDNNIDYYLKQQEEITAV